MASLNWKTTLYHRSPVWVQNLMASAYGWQKNRERFAHPKSKHWADFYRHTQNWTEEQLCEFQWSELRRTLQHAETTSPFFRRRFQDAGITSADIRQPSDLQKLPLLTKQDLADFGREMISEEFDPAAVPSHPTSGSTGMPLKLYCDRESMARNFAFRWSECRLGIPRRTRYAHFTGLDLVGPTQTQPPFWRMNYANHQRMYSVFHLSDEWMPSYIDDLNQFRPVWIYGYPSALYVLADFMERTGRRLEHPIQGIVTSSEQCLPERREKIEAMFGTRVWDEYGQAELVCVAFQCECGKLHEKRNFSFVEFLPTGEQEAGLDICEIVGTSTINRAWPLLRYQTGDMALIDPAAKCPLGRPGRVIERIYGRTSHFLELNDGRRVASIGPIVTKCRNLTSVQAIQEKKGEITLHIVPTDNYDRVVDEAWLLLQFRNRLGDESNVKLHLHYANSPVLTKSGKFLMVIAKPSTG